MTIEVLVPNLQRSIIQRSLSVMSSGSLVAKWSRITLSTATNAYNRSSHSLAVLGDYAYLFGGEQRPRIPVASDILVIGLKGMSSLVYVRSAVDCTQLI